MLNLNFSLAYFLPLLLKTFLYVLVLWSDFRTNNGAHDIFQKLELVLSLRKFIAITFEIVKEWTMGFSQALSSLRSRCVFRTQSGV